MLGRKHEQCRGQQQFYNIFELLSTHNIVRSRLLASQYGWPHCSHFNNCQCQFYYAIDINKRHSYIGINSSVKWRCVQHDFLNKLFAIIFSLYRLPFSVNLGDHIVTSDMRYDLGRLRKEIIFRINFRAFGFNSVAVPRIRKVQKKKRDVDTQYRMNKNVILDSLAPWMLSKI